MNSKNLFLIYGILLVLTLSFVSADYKFQNDSGIDLGVLSSSNGNLSILGNISAQNFIGSGKFLSDLDVSPDDVDYWDKSGTDLFYLGGNVGVGFSSPSEKLSVNGKIKTDDEIISISSLTFNSVTSPGLNFSNPHGEIIFTPLSSTWAYFYTDRDNFIFGAPVYSLENKFSSYDAGDLELLIGATTRILIDGDTGNVGMGTTNPQNTLNVIGDANFTGELYANGNRIDNLNATGLIINWSGETDLSNYVPYSGGNSNLTLSGHNITANYLIGDGSLLTGISAGSIWEINDSDIYYNDGNVGINISSPASSLNVNGDILVSAAKDLIFSHATSDNDWSIGAEGENLLIREKDQSDKFYVGFYDDSRVAMGVGAEILKINGSEIQVQDTIRFFEPKDVGSGTKDILLEYYTNTETDDGGTCYENKPNECAPSSYPSFPAESCGSSYLDTVVIKSETYYSDSCEYSALAGMCIGTANSNRRTYCTGWKAV